MTTSDQPVTPEVFMRNWPLSEVTLGPVLEGYGGGTVGVVHAKQGRFVYKRTPASVPHVNERSAFVLDFLADRGSSHAPRLVHTKDGTRTLEVAGASIMLMEHIEGGRPGPTPTTYTKLGAMLAELNSIDDYPFDAPVTVDAIRPDFASMARRLQREADQDRFVELAASLGDIDSLPRSLIHFDMNLANVVERPDGMLVAVDWDEAGIGARILDPAHFLISSFVTEEPGFDVERADAFYRSYGADLTLTDGELAAMLDAAIFHALRSVVWADTERRWQRIQWAVERRHEVMSMIVRALGA